MKPVPKWTTIGSSLVTGVTGVVYFVLKRFWVSTDPFAVGHPLEPWLLKAHILAAPVLVFMLGFITMEHAWRHYRSSTRAGRRSGLLTTLLVAPMIGTGYLIQTATSPGWLTALSWLHLVTGLLFLGGLLAHQEPVRRKA